VTTLPTGTRQRTRRLHRTRSSARSSQAKIGAGATSTRSRSSSTGSGAKHASQRRRSCSNSWPRTMSPSSAARGAPLRPPRRRRARRRTRLSRLWQRRARVPPYRSRLGAATARARLGARQRPSTTQGAGPQDRRDLPVRRGLRARPPRLRRARRRRPGEETEARAWSQQTPADSSQRSSSTGSAAGRTSGHPAPAVSQIPKYLSRQPR
jgi:hypothetical protein